MNRQQLIVFMKPPIEGRCKTRLIPLLGEYSATRLYRQMVMRCMQQLETLTHTDINLCVACDSAEDIDHPFIQQLQQQFSLRVSMQSGNDLGERMHHAITDSLKDYDRCVIIGTDCPEMTSAYIDSAFEQLSQSQLVLGPACDGGYVLLGCSQPVPTLFDDIAWSTHHVLQQTLGAAQRSVYRYQLLPTLWDVDTPEDYIQHYQRIKQLLNTFTHISEPSVSIYHESEAG